MGKQITLSEVARRRCSGRYGVRKTRVVQQWIDLTGSATTRTSRVIRPDFVDLTGSATTRTSRVIRPDFVELTVRSCHSVSVPIPSLMSLGDFGEILEETLVDFLMRQAGVLRRAESMFEPVSECALSIESGETLSSDDTWSSSNGVDEYEVDAWLRDDDSTITWLSGPRRSPSSRSSSDPDAPYT